VSRRRYVLAALANLAHYVSAALANLALIDALLFLLGVNLFFFKEVRPCASLFAILLLTQDLL